MWRRLWLLARRVVVGGALLALVCFGYFWLSTPLPTRAALRERAALGSTRILDRRGQLLATIADPLGGYQQPVALSGMPLALRQQQFQMWQKRHARRRFRAVDVRSYTTS